MILIQHATELIASSRQMVMFTGAGVSTASGIPDFRNPVSGLWSHQDPMTVASLSGFRQNPHLFFDWVHPLVEKILCAQPSLAHEATTALEQTGYLQAVITQNIDQLHQKAGSQRVYELHGQFGTATCTHCFQKYDTLPLLQEFRQTGDMPYCPCQPHGAVIKPDVILFGEQLPYKTVMAARQVLKHADLILVAGSSLLVEPANQIPQAAVRHGARLIVVNNEQTPADAYADVVIHDDVNIILPAIVRELKNRE